MNKKPKATVPNDDRKNHSLALCKIPAVEWKGGTNRVRPFVFDDGNRRRQNESSKNRLANRMCLGVEDICLSIGLLESSIALHLA